MVGELDRDQCLTLLDACCFGHLGCHAKDKTYVVPITFVRDGDGLIGQTKAGLKIDMMRENPHVCVQVEEITSISEWKSVIAWGSYEELQGFAATQAMTQLIDRFAEQVSVLGTSRSPREVTPGRHDGRPLTAIVYRIRIEEITGRYESL